MIAICTLRGFIPKSSDSAVPEDFRKLIVFYSCFRLRIEFDDDPAANLAVDNVGRGGDDVIEADNVRQRR